ncbi:MAG TPA: ABC transporter permease [Candidatus Angelobacter sp.]|nr:ABC transporter permease [Candidatus Angelobacter sp.]
MYWINRLFRKEKTESRLDAELRFHLEERTADYVRGGMQPMEARRAAQVEFGGLEGIKEECRESRKVHGFDVLLQDLRYGLRMMGKAPGFTLVALLTLALGIGANTAIFSVVNGVLLNPLPYPHPEQLVGLHASKPNFQNGSISYPNFRDWQRENRTFSAMAIYRIDAASLTGLGDAKQVRSTFISADFFPLLGVSPIVGRSIEKGEDEVGAAPVALISRDLWRRKFGAATSAIGKSITLDGKSYTIIGVIPADFDLVVPGLRASAVYLPIGQLNNPLLQHRAAGLGIHGVGRLKAGVGIEQARADMDRISRSLAAAYPDDDKGTAASMAPLKAQMVGQIQPFLVLLLVAVGFVLLIVCVNIANLVLARSNRRMREFAVRLALGASKRRVIRQVLTESVLLSFLGGGLGLLLAAWGTRMLLRTLPAALPRAGEVGMDGRVLAFTTVISLLAGVLFGLIPALKTSRADVITPLKEGSHSLQGSRYGAQNAFVIVELALALVLLAGAGLMIRSLMGLWNIDPGFDPSNVLTFGVSLPPSMMKASAEEVRTAFRAMDSRLLSVPEMTAASFSWGAFPLQSDDEVLFWMDGRPRPVSANDMNWALRYVVGPGYLRAMGISLLRGRFIDARDEEKAPYVAVIDEAFQRKFFPDDDPIGKRIHLDDGDDHGRLAEIVGVVKHVKQWGLDTDGTHPLQAQMYLSFFQLPDQAMRLASGGTSVVVRSTAATSGLFTSIQASLRQMNSEQVVYAPDTMEQTVSNSLAARRYSFILLGGFAFLALTLASMGIYGVVSCMIGQRMREIGIRMALGAQQIHVLGLVMAQGVRLVILGAGIGLAAAMALTRLMVSLLFGVSATDPLTFLCVVILLMLVGLLACALPARRALRVDPVRSLKCE